MAMIERTVRNVFEIKDNVSPGITAIGRKVETLNKGYKTLAVTTGTIEKVGGHYEKRLRTTITKTTSLSKRLTDLGGNMYRTGRRTMYMGFVMSSVWRRVSRAISGVVGAVSGLISEFTDAEKASDWLGQTLQRLAMGGQLTGDQVEEVIRVWQKWWDVSIDLGREMAELETKFVDLKTTAATSTLEFVTAVNEKLGELDWDTVTTSIGELADAFYNELIAAIDDVDFEDLLTNLEVVGTLAGTFMGGVIERSTEIISSLDSIVGVGGEEGSGLKWVVHWLGKVTLDLGLIAIPAIVLGAVIAGIGQIAGAARVAWKAIAFIGTKLGLLPLEVVISIIIIGGALAVIKGIWDTWVKLRDAGVYSWAGTPKFDIPDVGVTRPGPGYDKEDPLAGMYDPATGQPYPTEQAGGLISRTGLYRLHAGERVISTRGRGGSGGGNNITINVYGARNPEETAQAIGRKIRTVMIFP